MITTREATIHKVHCTSFSALILPRDRLKRFENNAPKSELTLFSVGWLFVHNQFGGMTTQRQGSSTQRLRLCHRSLALDRFVAISAVRGP